MTATSAKLLEHPIIWQINLFTTTFIAANVCIIVADQVTHLIAEGPEPVFKPVLALVMTIIVFVVVRGIEILLRGAHQRKVEGS